MTAKAASDSPAQEPNTKGTWWTKVIKRNRSTEVTSDSPDQINFPPSVSYKRIHESDEKETKKPVLSHNSHIFPFFLKYSATKQPPRYLSEDKV